MIVAEERPRTAPPRTQFLDDAEAFARRHRDAWAFRYLRWYTGCSESELHMLVAKIYCDALLESSTGSESPASSAVRSLLHPFFYLLRKSVLGRPAPFVETELETLDRPYFDRWFAKTYAALKAPKRLLPRTPVGFEGFDLSLRFDRCVAPATLAKLFVAPLWIPWLLIRPPEAVRPRFLRAYRKALSFFAIYDGHFARFPCRDFVTFSDESNHPARYLAFKRRCPGRMIVVQNGAREIHPVHAFGMVDVYLVFGEFARRAYRDLRMRVEKIEVVGALCLDERYPLLLELRGTSPETEYDIVLIDQSVWPYNGVDPRAGQALLDLMTNVGRYQQRRPKCRIAYQLRLYHGAEQEKNAVLAEARARLGPKVAVLENAGKGDSYRTIYRSRLVMTFSSTLGIEGFFFGEDKRALFVNYSGSPCHDFAPEPRFQLTGDPSDYAEFERRVDELLALDQRGIPESVREHYAFFDGKVEERIAAAIAREQK